MHRKITSKMANSVKQHETNVATTSDAQSVNDILQSVENVPFALSGATTKTILYTLFSGIAAVELTSALGFYGTSLGMSLMVAFTICGFVASGFHYLLHSILSNTAHGIVFKKRAESKAMSTEVVANIVLSVVLLLAASCTVFFVGKKGFSAYRATNFETKMKATDAPPPTITPEMLTSKRGKISVYKLELLGKLEQAKAASTDATTNQNTTEKDSYDKTTNTITDIVGASAFVLELLLALLAFTIATAKKAAVIEEIVRRKSNDDDAKTVNNRENDNRNGEIIENRNGLLPKKTVTVDSDFKPFTPTIPSDKRLTDNRKDDTSQRPKIGFMAQKIENKYEGICPNCSEKFERKNPKKVYCSTNCKTQFWQQKNGVTIYGEQLNN
jgi:hypothetical protein